jgi:predicted nucleic acid-binding Zn ribbon protein
MKSLKNLLTKKFPEKQLRRGVLDDATVFFVFKKVIQEEFGNLGIENFRADYYKNGTIFIRCQSSAWASELWLNKNRIVRKVNKELGESIITEIKTK